MAYRRIDDSVPLDVDFRLAREGCVNLLSLLLPSSLGITLSSSCTLSLSLSFPPLCLFYSLERVSRSDMALPIGADTPRGVEADSTRVESFVRPSAGHPPPCCVHSAACSLAPVIPLQLLPS